MSFRHTIVKNYAFLAFMFFLTACELVNTGDDAIEPSANEDRYGSIAFSESTQKWHIRWNVTGQERADVLAKQYCGASDCRVVLQFGPGQCGTFSLGEEGALGAGVGLTPGEAANVARKNCSLLGQSCKVAPVRCNNAS